MAINKLDCNSTPESNEIQLGPIALSDETATLSFAQSLAKAMRPGLVVYLTGDLGAGKTTLTRGLIQALGYTGKVKSPTYTLVEPYVVSGYNLYHFDLYRFNDEEEWESAGFREFFDTQNICVVEWPEKAMHLLPKPDLAITLEHSATGRLITLRASTPLGRASLHELSVS